MFSKTQTLSTASILQSTIQNPTEFSQKGQNPREIAFQNVYKIWSAFTKTLRTIYLKYMDDDIIIRTGYFGRFFVPRLNRKEYGIRRPVIYQPPGELAAVCSQVAQDKYTLPPGERYQFRQNAQSTEQEVTKEVKISMLSIAKASDLSQNFVEQTLEGLVDHLVTLI